MLEFHAPCFHNQNLLFIKYNLVAVEINKWKDGTNWNKKKQPLLTFQAFELPKRMQPKEYAFL